MLLFLVSAPRPAGNLHVVNSIQILVNQEKGLFRNRKKNSNVGLTDKTMLGSVCCLMGKKWIMSILRIKLAHVLHSFVSVAQILFCPWTTELARDDRSLRF
jgi:hypothetical protein